MMNWDDLRVFAELARSGSLSEAARRLRVDHSTVARRINALESRLELRLFDRLARGYALTPEGEELAVRVARLEEDVFALTGLAAAQGVAIRGTVRISAPPAFASRFLAPRLGGLRREHPGIEIELAGDSRSVSLTRGEADIALRLQSPEGDQLAARRLGHIAFGLYATEGYVEGRERETWDYLGYGESLDHVPQQQWLHRDRGTAPAGAGKPAWRLNAIRQAKSLTCWYEPTQPASIAKSCIR